MAQFIAIQLLASCFTPAQDMNTATLPNECQHERRHQADGISEEKRLISSLRQHSQHKHSPAYGHQARNNSVVDTWSDKDTGVSREARLAEEVSYRRRIKAGK